MTVSRMTNWVFLTIAVLLVPTAGGEFLAAQDVAVPSTQQDRQKRSGLNQIEQIQRELSRLQNQLTDERGSSRDRFIEMRPQPEIRGRGDHPGMQDRSRGRAAEGETAAIGRILQMLRSALQEAERAGRNDLARVIRDRIGELEQELARSQRPATGATSLDQMQREIQGLREEVRELNRKQDRLLDLLERLITRQPNSAPKDPRFVPLENSVPFENSQRRYQPDLRPRPDRPRDAGNRSPQLRPEPSRPVTPDRPATFLDTIESDAPAEILPGPETGIPSDDPPSLEELDAVPRVLQPRQPAPSRNEPVDSLGSDET